MKATDLVYTAEDFISEDSATSAQQTANDPTVGAADAPAENNTNVGGKNQQVVPQDNIQSVKQEVINTINSITDMKTLNKIKELLQPKETPAPEKSKTQEPQPQQ